MNNINKTFTSETFGVVNNIKKTFMNNIGVRMSCSFLCMGTCVSADCIDSTVVRTCIGACIDPAAATGISSNSLATTAEFEEAYAVAGAGRERVPQTYVV